MKLKFTATTMKEYKGHDGNGGELSLCAGDEADVSDATASELIRHYSRDFQEVIEDKEHAPKENKMAKKSAKFKSK